MAMFSREYKMVSPLDHPDFTTHKHYITYVRQLSNNLELTYKSKLTGRISLSSRAKKKIRLIELTLENVRSEAKMVEKNPEYAQAAISWLPVKAYYLIFNLTILLEYVISTDESFLTASHTKSLSQFKSLLGSGSITFNQPIFNERPTGAEIEKMKVLKSDNLRGGTVTRKEQVFRKLADYAKDDLRRFHRVKRLNKDQMRDFRARQFSLSETFYWYRIKANYGDLEFISDKVRTSEFKDLYTQYCFLTANYYLAIKKCINKIGLARSGEVILK